MVSVIIIASGAMYQRAAAFAAGTYRVQLKGSARVSICLPEREDRSKDVEAVRDVIGVEVRHFPFRQVSEQKFVSQLKCQGFLHCVSGLKEDEVVLFVDADTFCLKPFSVARFSGELVQGKIGMVPDIVDRHTPDATALGMCRQRIALLT